jgi:hypothetical protein
MQELLQVVFRGRGSISTETERYIATGGGKRLGPPKLGTDATDATEFAELTDEESGVGRDARFVDIVSVHPRPPGPVRVFDMVIIIICIGTAQSHPLW